jgi:hypothetical protein
MNQHVSHAVEQDAVAQSQWEFSRHHASFRPTAPAAAPPAPVQVSERRREPRHKINGSAHLIALSGKTLNVELVDLSRGGALVTAPKLAQVFVGESFKVAGSAMPWEREAQVVGVSHRGLHLAFAA